MTGVFGQRRLGVLMWGFASTPVVWLVLFGVFILRARIALGRWPVPYQPDPNELGFDLHYMALVAGFPLMFVTTLCAIVLTVFVQHDQPRHTWLIRLTALTSLVVVIALARTDPSYVFTWLGD